MEFIFFKLVANSNALKAPSTGYLSDAVRFDSGPSGYPAAAFSSFYSASLQSCDPATKPIVVAIPSHLNRVFSSFAAMATRGYRFCFVH